MQDREMPVWERILRRDAEPPRPYQILGDHHDDHQFLVVAYDDGLQESVRKDMIYMLPKMAQVHQDLRRQAQELGIDLAHG